MQKKRTIVELLDDFDGTPGATTVDFSFQGTQYEIELSDEHLNEMQEYLQPYIKAGRRKNGSKGRASVSRKPKVKPDNAAIREWARSTGIDVSKTGRIPKSVIEQYQSAH
jgi:Lsr2